MTITCIFLINGIFLNLQPEKTIDAYTKFLKDGRFDLLYIVNKIDDGESVAPYYSRNGSKNYGHYNPTDELEEILKNCEANCSNDMIEVDSREAIYTQLAKDYANIFLWAPFSYYAYNQEYIMMKSSDAIIPADAFFDPRIWDRNIWNMREHF